MKRAAYSQVCQGGVKGIGEMGVAGGTTTNFTRRLAYNKQPREHSVVLVLEKTHFRSHEEREEGIEMLLARRMGKGGYSSIVDTCGFHGVRFPQRESSSLFPLSLSLPPDQIPVIRFVEVEAHCEKLHRIIERVIPEVKRVSVYFNKKKLIILFQ